jgi:hypothetical protein
MFIKTNKMKPTKFLNKLAVFSIISFAVITGCSKDENTPINQSTKIFKINTQASSILGSAASFAVLGGTTVTNDGSSIITGNLGVSPGTAITGFMAAPYNTIMGPGTVTAGLGIVNGTIYAGGPVAAQAHNDAVIAYNYLSALTPNNTYSGVTQLDGLTLTPGVYSFAPSANLQVNGTLYLDFQGNSSALFVFQMGTTLVTMTGSNIIALNNNNQTCVDSNIYWVVGSSATIDGNNFLGTILATESISMTSGGIVSGRMLALNGAVTLINDSISICSSSDEGNTGYTCRDFVTGGGWIDGSSTGSNNKHDKATFGVSGGIKNDKFWGQLSFNDHSKNGIKVKSSSITAYVIIDQFTRRIVGTATINGKGSYIFTAIVVDNGEPGTNDKFSLELSNGYIITGTLQGGNIQLHYKCGPKDNKDKESYEDKNEKEGNDDN